MKKMSKKKPLLFIAVLLVATIVLSSCSAEQVLQDIATNFIMVNIANSSGTLLAESDENEQIYTYSISADITNSYILPLVNAEIKLNVPDNVEIVSNLGDDETIREPLVEHNEVKNYEWIVKIPMTNEDQNLEYNVSVESEVSSIVQSYGLLFVDGINPQDKRLDFSTDTWSFSNYGQTPIPLLQEDYDALLYGVGADNTVREWVKSVIQENADGYCYGMAITSILTKVGRLDETDIDADADNLHSLKKNDETKSLIGYYWIMQYLDVVNDEKTLFNTKTTTEKLNIIEEKAKNVENGGNPFILSFYTQPNNQEGHAVVGYSHERGSFEWNDVTYDSRILVYDSNYPKWTAKSCLYYNKNSNSWYIPNYPESSSISRALSDINLMDGMNINMNKKSVNSYITAKGNEQLSIYTLSGDLIGSVDGASMSSGDRIVTYRNDGDDDLVIAILPADETISEKEAYVFKPEDSTEPIDLKISYDNHYMEASSQTSEAVTFSPDGYVEIAGDTNDFEIGIVANEGYYPTDWYKLSVTGDSGKKPKIEISNNGYVLSGVDMEGVKVRAENETSAQELKIKMDENSVLLSQQGDNLCAAVDSDDDGTYETIIATGKDASTFSSNTGSAKIGILCGIIVAVVLIAAVVVTFVVLKSKKRPKQQTDSGGNKGFL